MAQKQQKQKKAQAKRAPAYSSDSMAVSLIMGLLLVALGVLIFMATALDMAGDVFDALRQVSRGMMGAVAIALPALPVWGGVLMLISIQRKPPVRPFLLACVLMTLACTAATLLTQVSGNASLMAYIQSIIQHSYMPDTMSTYLARAYAVGSGYTVGGQTYVAGGGLVGMLLAWPLWKGVGVTMGAAVTILAAVVTFLFLIRLDVKGIAARSKQKGDERRVRREQEDAARQAQELAWQQEQMRRQQEQQRIQQEQYRQQQLRQQQMPAYQPPTPSQGVPIVRQQQATAYGFPPTPEEKGEVPVMPQDSGKKKRGGVIDHSQDGQRRATSRRGSLFGQPVEAAEPAMPAEGKPTRRRGLFAQFAQPEETKDVPETVYAAGDEDLYAPEEPEQPAVPVTPAPAQVAPVRPAPATPVSARRAVATPPAPVQPEPAPAQEEPAEELPHSSFLQRLRAAKKEAGIQVPEEELPPRRARHESREPQEENPPRPVARAAKTDTPWEDIPPWDESLEEDKKPRAAVAAGEPKIQSARSHIAHTAASTIPKPKAAPYVYPTLDLIRKPEGGTGFSAEEDALRTRRLENTLQSFRVPAKVRHITHGPVISRFELELAPGIKVSKVTDLNRNIAMNMEVKTVRIEAPIPGKSLVGVEVPNRTRTNVTLREVLESDVMRAAKAPLVVALGKDIAGTPIVCDLAKMPHMLIAGATGSGKSVCVNTIINSLLYRRTPQEVRLILIDPKVVELQCYNGIPHLLIPVVTDPHKASGALAWAVGEMMDRYKRFEGAGVRAIDGYNDKLPKGEEKMPHIVIIIDELADLMLSCKKDVEERICRLAQLARAAGIHLIVATQRPSVDVITGTIKANIPSRIAFKVSSAVDSRTILDRQGAEQLLGYGDMLYMPTGEFTPIRVQGCFLKDDEVNRVTDFIRENCPSDYDPAVMEELERLQNDAEVGLSPVMPTGDENPNSDESLISQCIEMAVTEGQLSTSTIQRRLKLGYARAGRLMDELEERGIVTPKDGSKPRECRISRDEFEAMKAAGELD